jgi:ABC-type lipoprotein export system ATPase subunit
MGELLSLSGVCKSYDLGGRRLRVLSDVELEVRTREIVAVVGGRDEGKTTLLQIAAGLQPPDRGEVRLAGVDLAQCSNQERAKLLAREVAWVGREIPLDFRMLDYVALPLMVGRRHRKRKAEALAMAALERVGAEECAGRRWKELSNWEQVMVDFARAIVRGPGLLVVDDVIGGFGVDRTREAGELLLSFLADPGCSVLMSTSDPEAALVAERVWRFERGGLRLTYNEYSGDAEIIDIDEGARRRQGARRSP